MKYHYQYVSKTSIRIELIPEDRKETELIESLGQTKNKNNPELAEYFHIALRTYHHEAMLTKINFMQFPKVALCSFENSTQTAPSAV